MPTRLLAAALGALAACGGALAPASAAAPASPMLRTFQRSVLSDKFYCEGADAGDFNRDGKADVVAGPFIFWGPTFQERTEIDEPKALNIEGYSELFFAFPYDVDGDGWLDVVSVGFPGNAACWYRNPQGAAARWERHVACEHVDNESPAFADVTGDGRPELVFHVGGQFGFAEIPPKAQATGLWRFTSISDDRKYDRFNHGLGVGDLNGDRRADVLERAGWWEQPADIAAGKEWAFHPVQFAEGGGAQMLVADFDGDGDNDVVSSQNAHAYGLAWFENGGAAASFVKHPIMGDKPEQNDYGVAFSQLHALALADMDGDGAQDFVTGKRYWAHSTHDPGSLDPAVLYWFQAVRENEGSPKVRFVPHLIDNDSGVGTQVTVDDLNGDKLPDVIVGNKKGIFTFVQQAKTVDQAAFDAAQPQRIQASTVATVAAAAPPQAVDAGFPATAADGSRLNLDFENGTLKDWTADGPAFEGQPVRGDTISRRLGGQTSGYAGDYWLGTYEVNEDGPQGTLTSIPFKVTHPYATFLVGGGSHEETRVDLIRKSDGQVILSARGSDMEQMHPVACDLSAEMGKEILLKVVDQASFGWGHVNFDDFRFHDAKPNLPIFAPKILKADDYPYARIPGDEAARVMRVPDGFSVKLSAEEPDVQQPIAMAIDERGRVWIAEAFEYPQRALFRKGRDRILVFEDTDGDGKFDSRKVFAEGLNLVSGLEVGFGGVWVGAAPYLMFIPDANGDDVADGEPQVLLDGWGYQDTHETLNTFNWGPDGWLYGCQGVFTHSRVGKPGTPDSERVPLNACIWRYHPTRHKFEVFAHGTSNPWGVDFDDHGQAFATACVIPHLYHIIQGGRYQRQAGEHFNPYTYDDIKTIADHLHYLGDNAWAGNDRSDSVGGGHAHAGAMIYLGGAWPEEYRGKLLMNNIHGQRLNMDSLHPSGSGFIGSHEPDFLLTGDRASQMLNLRYGPDGQAFVIDWYDMQACHDPNADVHDRTNGRIYKIVYGQTKPVVADLRTKSDVELAEMCLDANDWYVRNSRRLLQERTAAGKLDPAARNRLAEMAISNADDTRRLRAMWALHVTGGLPVDVAAKLWQDKSEFVRAWTIQLLLDRDDADLGDLVPRLAELARTDPSPVVRLYVAAAAQRIPVEQRWEIAAALVAHSEDAGDHNLPLLDWYAAEPLAGVDPQRALDLGLSASKTIPEFADFMVRRVGAIGTPATLASLVRALGAAEDETGQTLLLSGIRSSLAGQRQATAPAEWAAVFQKLRGSSSAAVRMEATSLGVTFGDGQAMAALRELAASPAVDSGQRRAAIESLLGAKDPQLAALLRQLLADSAMRGLALRGLASYDDPQTPAAVLAIYDGLGLDEKRAALSTLAARAGSARELLKAVNEKKIPTTDLSADLVRQLGNLDDAEVQRLAAKAWGTVRSTPADKIALIAKYKAMWEGAHEVAPDKELGRTMFARTCQQCHTLYGVGAKIGPDLTGSNRADINYVLANVVDPNALIAKEYQTTVVMTDDGRVITGIVAGEDKESLTIKNSTETLTIPKDEIEERNLGAASMMPENQLQPFTDHEVLSLFAYLTDKTQSPMLATKETAELLFNGRDLTGWNGDPAIWSVAGGEIVGKTAGIEHNSFLVSDMAAENFKLSLDVKLVDNQGNSGVQFRSKPIDGFHELRGCQADIGADWWGKLYEENGRELLWDKSGEQFVKSGDWNKYEIEAVGPHIRTWINGHVCVDLDDPTGAPRGIFALQMHSGGGTEVRYRNLKLEVLDAAKAGAQ